MFKKIGLVAVVLVAFFAVIGFAMAQDEAATESIAVTQEIVNVGNKACPVTGMAIENVGENSVEYNGKAYNVCSVTCKEKFLAEPDKYIAVVEKELAEAAPVVE